MYAVIITVNQVNILYVILVTKYGPKYFPLQTLFTVGSVDIYSLRATAVPVGTAVARISYGDSVRPSVCLSRPGGEPSPARWDRDSEPQNMGFKWFFFAILGCDAHLGECSLKYTGDRPRQPAYEIKLMLWRVSWALYSSDFLFSLTSSDISSNHNWPKVRFDNGVSSNLCTLAWLVLSELGHVVEKLSIVVNVVK